MRADRAFVDAAHLQRKQLCCLFTQRPSLIDGAGIEVNMGVIALDPLHLNPSKTRSNPHRFPQVTRHIRRKQRSPAMKNAETPVVKVVLYGAMSSLGSALMAEMLRRQHEVIAILDDLTALAPRPGLRTKTGDLFDADRVKQSVAGSSAVICLLDAPGLPFNSEYVEKTIVPGPVEQVLAVDALIDGMRAAGVARLFLVGDFEVLDDPEIDDGLQRHAAEEIREALQSSALQWTLVNAPRGVPGLTIEHFSQVSSSLEPGLADPLKRLTRTAVGIADELRLNLHIGEHVNFIAAEP
jgi:putative NADH-flavin reductase